MNELSLIIWCAYFGVAGVIILAVIVAYLLVEMALQKRRLTELEEAIDSEPMGRSADPRFQTL